MDKQNEVYTYNGMVSSLCNEWHSDTSFHMDEPWKHYAKSNNTDKKGEILHDCTHTSYLR